MKKLPPDITDEELHDAFREAAAAWPPAAGSAEKDAGWKKMQAMLAAAGGAAAYPAPAENIRRRSKLLMVLLLCAMLVTCWMIKPGSKKTARENKIPASSGAIASSGTLSAEKQLSKTDAAGEADAAGKSDPAVREKTTSNGKGTGPSASEWKNSARDAAENEQQAEHHAAADAGGHAGSAAAGNNNQQNAAQDMKKSEQQIVPLPVPGITQRMQRHPESFAMRGDPISEAMSNSRDAVENPAAGKEITGMRAENAKQQAEDARQQAENTRQQPENVKQKEPQAAKPEGKKAEQKNGSRFARWAVGLTLGPDWSMVGGKSQARAGLDKGITIQYRISRKWSLETGILLASKIYSARPEDYHSVNPYPNATAIDASCRVIDLPLNVRYNIWQPEKEQVFAVAGLSSFWMQKESYRFTYDANGASPTSETDIYHQNRHLLSIANMALGYEHTWGRISAQASTYVKIPLAGIGYGRVKLFSTGILASVKYNF
jgi:hypothetical protein